MRPITAQQSRRLPATRRGIATAIALAGALCAAPALADGASGKLVFQARAGEIVLDVRHAYLVSGPDMVSGAKIRRLLLSPVDLSADLAKCEELACATWDMGEGITVDFDSPPRLPYWFVANGQRVQHSGGARKDTVKLDVDTPERLAGTWVLSAEGGGPAVSVKFDAKLLKAFKK